MFLGGNDFYWILFDAKSKFQNYILRRFIPGLPKNADSSTRPVEGGGEGGEGG